MSAFIVKDDYGTVVRQSLLDGVTEMDDTKLDAAEKRAVQLAKDYLNVRFDISEIFNKLGDDRNPQLVGAIVDISLYYLHRRLNPRKVPSHRKDGYDEAMEWLEMVRSGEIQPDFPTPEAEEEQKSTVDWGSNPKRTNHI